MLFSGDEFNDVWSREDPPGWELVLVDDDK
jgi:hypothetical protein